MNKTHAETVIDMISRSFADKGDLTTLAQVTYNDLVEQISILWESLLKAGLSFVVIDQSKNEDDQVIGACLNFDARSKEAEPLCAISAFDRANVEGNMNTDNSGEEDDKNSIDTNSDITDDSGEEDDKNSIDKNSDIPEKETPMSVVEFLQAVEEPLKDEHLPDALGKTIYTSLLGTSAKLSAAENVQVS